MDWIRRNWPDLLIGIALVAVIAGIIATLLTGGSFFPLGASQASSNRPDQSSLPSFEANTTPRDVTQPSVDTSPTRDSTSASDESSVQSSGEPVSVSALPLPGTGSEQETEEPTAGQAQDSNAQQPTGQQTTSQQTTSQQTTGEQPATQMPDPDQEGVYRISVGAFSGEENADRQAQTFRDAGYPVFIGTQGDLSIVLVGPYDDLAEAERVAARIREGGFRIEPVIYRFQADSESGGDTAPATATTRPVAPTPQPTAAQATAGSYLQVGAYATRESSQPQRERLESLGFRVSERVENDLVKLLVGPFEDDNISQASALLSEQGIDHFPR